jgi:hypothetical protein
MEIDLARHALRTAFRSSRELRELLGLLKDHCNQAEYAEFSKAIATAIASIQLEVVNRLTAAHPALESEIETIIGKYDRYL